jgi:prevent-host-death family protein
MTMKVISVSEVKATLSEQLRRVRSGEEVIITDRGRAVARLVPVAPPNDAGLAELEATGLVRRGSRPLGREFWSLSRPDDADSALRMAVRAEREQGW